MRGMNGSHELAIAYIHGRLDAKIESTIEREIEIWSERLRVSPMAIKARLGALSVGAESDRVPGAWMPEAVSARMGDTPPAMEVARETRKGAPVGNDRRGSTEAPALTSGEMNSAQKYWAQFTPKQRSKMMAARRKKWPAEARKKWEHGVHKGKNGGHRSPALQKLYRERAEAKRKGETPPPLPKEIAAA